MIVSYGTETILRLARTARDREAVEVVELDER